MFQAKLVEKFKIQILCTVHFFENRGIYELMWKNIVEWGRSNMSIWRMRIAYCIQKATNTHTAV
jgi:hypothetical protein